MRPETGRGKGRGTMAILALAISASAGIAVFFGVATEAPVRPPAGTSPAPDPAGRRPAPAPTKPHAAAADIGDSVRAESRDIARAGGSEEAPATGTTIRHGVHQVTVRLLRPRFEPPGGCEPAPGVDILVTGCLSGTIRRGTSDEHGRARFAIAQGSDIEIAALGLPDLASGPIVRARITGPVDLPLCLDPSTAGVAARLRVLSDDAGTPVTVGAVTLRGGTVVPSPSATVAPNQDAVLTLRSDAAAVLEFVQGPRLAILPVRTPFVPAGEILEMALPAVVLPPFDLVGRVIDGEGLPIAGATVKASAIWELPDAGTPGFRSLAVTTDATGCFAFGLPPAEGRLYASHPDFAPAERELRSGDVVLRRLQPRQDVIVRLPGRSDGPGTLTWVSGDGSSGLLRMTGDGDAIRFPAVFRGTPLALAFAGSGRAGVFTPPFATDAAGAILLVPSRASQEIRVRVSRRTAEMHDDEPVRITTRIAGQSFCLETGRLDGDVVRFADVPIDVPLRVSFAGVEVDAVFPETWIESP